MSLETTYKPNANLNLVETGAEPSSGELVKQQFDQLWKLYENRRVGVDIEHGARLYSDEAIATRYYDEGDIEEVYWRFSEYANTYKSGCKQTYIIQVSNEEGQHEIRVTDDNQVSVNWRPSPDDEWTRSEGDYAADCLDEFFHRASDAISKQTDRTPDQRRAADSHARTLMLTKYPYIFNQPVTSLE